MRAFPDTRRGNRSQAPMPQDRLDGIPWLIAGKMLITPFSARDGGLSGHEASAIAEMGIRLQRERLAGLLPDSVAYWFHPDGRTTPLTASQAWLKVKVMQHVVVDLHLLQAMGRVVPLTLLTPAPGPGDRRMHNRRAQKVVPAVPRSRVHSDYVAPPGNAA